MKNKFITEVDELKSYIDEVKKSISDVSNAQLNALEKAIEYEIDNAESIEELNYINQKLTQPLNMMLLDNNEDVDVENDTDVDSEEYKVIPVEEDNLVDDIYSTDDEYDSEDKDNIENYEDIPQPISMDNLLAVDENGEPEYENNLDTEDIKDSDYAIDVNELKEEAENTEFETVIPEVIDDYKNENEEDENFENDDIGPLEDTLVRDEDPILDPVTETTVTQAVESLENNIDNVKEALNIQTSNDITVPEDDDIEPLEDTLVRDDSQSTSFSLDELSNLN